MGAAHEGGVEALERWIAPDLRVVIEDRFWAPIERLTGLEAMIGDPSFVDDPGAHLALYADHGPNHARDVAARAATIAGWAFGALVPERSPERAELVTGVAVLMALVHDVGMCTDPPVGRRLHAQYAAQLVHAPEFAGVMDELLRADAGRLRTSIERAGLGRDVAVVAREVLACAVAHSKSTVPVAQLDDRGRFRTTLQYVCHTALADQLGADVGEIDDDGSFAWLVSDEHAELADDVIDAIRLVRAADALRQRGTTLRTSAGFEVVVDARTGGAATVVRSASRRSSYLLEVDTPIVVGEANIRGASLGPASLRFEFHRGALATDAAASRVADAVAHVIDDIQRDILPSFPTVAFAIDLVQPDDDPGFAARVRDAFVAHRPSLAAQTAVVPGPRYASVPPRFDWRGRGRPLLDARRALVLDRMEEHGTNVAATADAMFADALVVTVATGETLMEPGEDASFVVVPFEPGLVVTPLGGYRPAAVEPWIPVGTIGVLRGHDRNSAVLATRPMEVMVIPDDAFLAHWAAPFDARGLVERVRQRPPR